MSQLSFIVGQISQLNLGISLRSFFQILDLRPFYPAILRTLNSSKNCTLYKQNKKMLIKKCSITISIQAISIIWLLQCNYSMSTSVSFILVFQPLLSILFTTFAQVQIPLACLLLAIKHIHTHVYTLIGNSLWGAVREPDHLIISFIYMASLLYCACYLTTLAS